ncbi:MAG: DNA polymerase III subunit delta [Phycisphaerae bacterium]
MPVAPRRSSKASAATASPPDSRFYIVSGADAFLRRAELDALLARYGDDSQVFGVVSLAGASVELADVLDEVRSPALLAPRRTVVVRDADPFITAHRAALERYAEAPSDCGVLVLECRTCPSNTRLYKKAAALGGMIVCETPSRQRLPGWVTKRAASAYGVQVDEPTAELIVEHCGDDLGRIDSELSKLATFVADRGRIVEDDVATLTGWHRAELVFAVTDAVARRDARGALDHWNRVLAVDRDAPYRAIGGLAWGMRGLTAAKREVQRGADLRDAARAAGKRFASAGLERQLAAFTLRQWEDMLLSLLKLDVAAKSGGADVPAAVEQFIVANAARR